MTMMDSCEMCGSRSTHLHRDPTPRVVIGAPKWLPLLSAFKSGALAFSTGRSGATPGALHRPSGMKGKLHRE